MPKVNEVSNVDVVVYVLALLGGVEKTVYSEDVAARCYEVAPSRFSWQLPKYRQKGWPDKYIVRAGLEDAKKEKHGALVVGAYCPRVLGAGYAIVPVAHCGDCRRVRLQKGARLRG
jgi:hypothetical protein